MRRNKRLTLWLQFGTSVMSNQAFKRRVVNKSSDQEGQKSET